MITKRVTIRMCLICRRKLPQGELTRIVRSPKGQIEIDLTNKKAGRGAYLCSDENCWQRGLNAAPLGRALQASISPGTEEYLASQYREHLEKLNV